MPRIATVFLATGLQGMYRACFRACGLHLITSPGSSVIRALLKDGTFTPRAVTRDATSDAAQALLKQGCEVVEVQLDNKESVKKAVTGAEVVALVRWGGLQHPSVLLTSLPDYPAQVWPSGRPRGDAGHQHHRRLQGGWCQVCLFQVRTWRVQWRYSDLPSLALAPFPA